MWNKSIKLVTAVTTTEDKDGFDTELEEYLEHIPANFTSTTRSDEEMANQIGYTADINIEIAACNYSGEQFLYDEATGEKYEVMRSYQKDKSRHIILTCERRERGGKSTAGWTG